MEYLLFVLSENICFMGSIIVLSWDKGQWKGSGKKISKKVTSRVENLKT